MPKLKTNKGAAKRFKITGTGKVKRNKSGMRHMLTSKAKKVKRVLRKSDLVSKTHEDSIKKLLPYG
ncbi:MAG: 50S ribosomal protein L35 [Deltaproteobacteria bacterium GWA2_55_10]|nr:MAG: 50S ribosomal protein L35 [Deltaproteobacteria bacterium GWA2_55_10]